MIRTICTLFLSHLLIIHFASATSVPGTHKNFCPNELSVFPSCNCISMFGSSINTTFLQILCQKVEIFDVFNALKSYNGTIQKLAIKNCNRSLEFLSPIPKFEVKSLEISNCPIGKVDTHAFNSLSDTLQELWLFNDSLSEFPFINSLRHLQSIALNRNNITKISEHAFDGLAELKQLRLKFNRICNLHPNVLNNLKSTLELLDLSNNCLNAIPAQTLRNSPALTYLSLSHNQIEQITSMQFMNLPNLIELRLNQNKIARIQASGFMNVPRLKQLFLQNNSLSAIDPGTLMNFKELELIDLGSNLFARVPSFKDLTKLVEVRMNDNRIRIIDTLTFASNPNLKRIYLHDNVISSIARNSFDSLNALRALMLGGNSLTNIEKNMFDGMRNLQQLSLRNNSIERLGNYSFASVPELIALDLSENELKTITSTPFTYVTKLNLLILSNNSIEVFEENSFRNAISTILLDGNPLNCDKRIEWFIKYLVNNNVRTFVPGQPDILCAAPSDKEGVRLRDLMLEVQKNNSRHANSQMRSGINSGAANDQAAKILTQFLPGLSGTGRSDAGAQLLGSLSQNFPAIQNIPGLNMLTSPMMPKAGQFGMRASPNGQNFNSAVDKFTEPLVKFASGSTPEMSDVNQLLSSLPNLVVRVPNFGDVDISKLSPALVEHVIRGGQIPGIPRETLDFIIKQYMERMYAVAAAEQGISSTTEFPLPANLNSSHYLKPLQELPPGIIRGVLEGRPLPYLSEEKTQVIKDYYTQRLPIPNETEKPINLTELFPPKLVAMMHLLPPGYPIGKLPPEVLNAMMANKVPDFSVLPDDLQVYIHNNIDKFVKEFNKIPNITIAEVLDKLPYFPKFELTTFSPYDINRVDSELVVQDQNKASNVKLYTSIALGLIATITIVALTGFCVYMRYNNDISIVTSDTVPESLNVLKQYSMPDVVREQSFRPSASSTFRSSH